LFASVSVLALLLLTPAAAHAFSVAYSDGDESYPLHWEPDGPITFQQHYLGGGGLPIALIQGASRNAMTTWAELSRSDVSFEEQAVGLGRACPHGLPASHADQADDVCGGPVQDVDGESTLFFMESVWPFATEAIALTTVSYAAEGQIVDADISFNAVDYDWTVGDTEVHTDYESIALHEIGHLLGLDHSDVPGAVMVLDYDQGAVVRELSDDDAEGLESLYPCNEPACWGVVSYVSSGCTMAGEDRVKGNQRAALGPRARWLFLFFVVSTPLWRRTRGSKLRAGSAEKGRGPARLLMPGLVFLVGVLGAQHGEASTVLSLSVDDLVERSDLVVRGTVVDRTYYRDGIVWTRAIVEVSGCWRGVCDDFVELVQPGGQVDGFGTRAFGMPTFEPGDEVVLFLAGSKSGALQVVGLTQGCFQVAEDDSLARNLRGMKLVLPHDRSGTDSGVDGVATQGPQTISELFDLVVGR